MQFKNILEWFDGKSLDDVVSSALPALAESAELGYWKRGVSRSVKAMLGRQNVAIRWARSVEKALHVDYRHPLSEGLTNMHYGAFERAPRMLTEENVKKLRGRGFTHSPKRGVVQDVGSTIERWARANAGVAELVRLLDARRPRPVVVMGTLSPTVARTIREDLGIDAATIQSPPMHGEWVEIEWRGRKVQVYEIVIDWPEETRHGGSRFGYGHGSQCEACGHGIRNRFNWVPILTYDPAGVPYSLWVGRDCAEKLFGCEVDGEGIYAERTPAAANLA